jgi:hypothetical protein
MAAQIVRDPDGDMVSDRDDGVVVLGMHRSGTSAITSAFAACGYYVGREADQLGPNQYNPTGHWENTRILHAHEEVFSRLGGTFFDPPPAAAQLAASGWARALLGAQVESLLVEAGSAPVAIKDPRIGGLLPLWREIIDRGLHPVLVLRDPLEVAQSLHVRDGTPLPVALAGWELHLGALIEFLAGRQVTVAPYARLLADPALVGRVVAEASAHLADSRAAQLRTDHAAEALEIQYHRNHARRGEHDEWLTQQQADLWRWLDQLPPGRQVLEVPAKLRVVRAAARAGARQETERVTLRERRAELERQLAEADRVATARVSAVEVQLSAAKGEAAAARAGQRRAEAVYQALMGSFSWRITRPLRMAKAIRRARSRRR